MLGKGGKRGTSLEKLGFVCNRKKCVYFFFERFSLCVCLCVLLRKGSLWPQRRLLGAVTGLCVLCAKVRSRKLN